MRAGIDEFRQRHERFELNRLGVSQFVFSYDLINKVCNFSADRALADILPAAADAKRRRGKAAIQPGVA